MSVHSDDSSGSGVSSEDAHAAGGYESGSSSALATPLALHQAAHPPRMHMDALMLAPPPSPPPFPNQQQQQHQQEQGSQVATTSGQPWQQQQQQQQQPQRQAAAGSATATPGTLLSPISAALTFPLQMDASSAEAQAANLALSLAASRDQHSYSHGGTGALGSMVQRVRAASVTQAPVAMYNVSPRAAIPVPAAPSPSNAQHAPLDSPVEMLQQLLHRSAAPSAAHAVLSPSPAPPPAQVHEAHVIALADALSSSLSYSHSRSGVLGSPAAKKQQQQGCAERAALQLRQSQAQAEREADLDRSRGVGLEQELQHLQGQHRAELASQDRAHSYAQADLLTAFQCDRAESERRHLAAMEELREQLAQRDSDLAAHQQLYQSYSAQIQTELAALHDQVSEAHSAIQAHELHAREQVAVIQHLETERERMEQAQQQRDEAAQASRQRWESELVRRSEETLQCKQAFWEEERAEQRRLNTELTKQLQEQTDARNMLETKLASNESTRIELERERDRLGEALRREILQVKLLRDQNGSGVAEVASAHERLQQSQTEAAELSTAHSTLQREYTQLESLYKRLKDESHARISALQSECAQLQSGYGAELAGHERALRELARTRADRHALQHALIRLRDRARLARALSHWVASTFRRRERNRIVGDLARFHLRQTKRDAWTRWKSFNQNMARASQVRLDSERAVEASHAREDHFARVWFMRNLARTKLPEYFREWARLTRDKAALRDEEEQEAHGHGGRCRSERCAGSRSASRTRGSNSGSGHGGADSPSSGDGVPCACQSCEARLAAVSERSKKIELYHLLESERQGWASQRTLYETRLARGEEERAQQRREISALQTAFAQLRSQHDLAHEFQNFAKAVLHTPVAGSASVTAPTTNTPRKQLYGSDGLDVGGASAFTFEPVMPRAGMAVGADTAAQGEETRGSPRSRRSMSPPQRDRPATAPDDLGIVSTVGGMGAGARAESTPLRPSVSARPPPLDAPSPYIALLSGSRPRDPSPPPERGLSSAPASSPLRAVVDATAAAVAGPAPSASPLPARGAGQPQGSSLRAFMTAPAPEADGSPQTQQLQQLDLSALLEDIQTAHASRAARAELRSLRDSVEAEQGRLQVLEQLRREREREDREQARAGPSFPARHSSISGGAPRPLPSPADTAFMPPYPHARPLSDGHAAKLDPSVSKHKARPGAVKPRLTSPVRRTAAPQQYRAK